MVDVAEKLEAAQGKILAQLEAPVEKLADEVLGHINFRTNLEEAIEKRDWKGIAQIIDHEEDPRRIVLIYSALHLGELEAKRVGDIEAADELCLSARLIMDRRQLTPSQIAPHLQWLEGEEILPFGSESIISVLIDEDVAFMKPAEPVKAELTPIRFGELETLGVDFSLAARLTAEQFEQGRALLIVDQARSLGVLS